MRRSTLTVLLLCGVVIAAVPVVTATQETANGTGTASGTGTANGTGAAVVPGNLTVTEDRSIIRASPPDPNVPADHIIIASARNKTGLGFTGITIDYGETGIDVSGVDNESIARIGIDQGGNLGGARANLDVSSDVESVTVEDGVINITAGGNRIIQGSDEVIVVIEGLTNPEGGEYPVRLEVNPQTPGGVSTATLRIAVPETTETGTPPLPSGSAGPGFGVAVVLLAVLSLAALAVRRGSGR